MGGIAHHNEKSGINQFNLAKMTMPAFDMGMPDFFGKRMNELMKFNDDFVKSGNMDDMMKKFSGGQMDSNSNSYCYSSMSTFDNKGKKYEKTHSIAKTADGLKEERKTIDDRDEQLKQMSIGQYINDRGVETQ